MARFIKDRTKSKGQVPGSLIHIGKQKMEHTEMTSIEYDADDLIERDNVSIDSVAESIGKSNVTWINLYGIHDLKLMEKIRETFGLSSLLMEEVMNTDLRPKYEDGDTFDGFIFKMFHYDEQEKIIKAEQISLILGKNYVLTLQEQPGDVFNPVRERIRKSKGRIRQRGSDYLAYAIMDTVVDNYIYLIEVLGREVESFETELFNHANKTIVQDIYKLKTEISFMRKSVRPVRDMMQHLMKSENSLFEEVNQSYLKNLSELVVQASDSIELYNNMVSDQLNIYNTNVSNRGNEVMQVLTIFASIFIPLTFIAGIYGMNFEVIPELKFKYGYLAFWIVSLLVVTGLVIFFRRKKWF